MAVFGAIASGNIIDGALYMAMFGFGTVTLMSVAALVGNFVNPPLIVVPAGSRFVSGLLEKTKVSARAGAIVLTGTAKPMINDAITIFLLLIFLLISFLLFFGKGIKQGETFQKTEITDIAPTMSALLNISYPNVNTGQPLDFVIE